MASSPIKASIQKPTENIVRMETLTHPKGVGETLERSGNFLEPRLARAVGSPNSTPVWVGTVLKAMFSR